VKRRFRILLISPEYKIGIQARIPAALCALHNYICTQDPGEGPLPQRAVFNDNPTNQGQPNDVYHDQPDHDMIVEDDTNANNFRDRMAMEMWEDYQRILLEREIDEGPEEEEDIDQYYGSEDDANEDVL
jgi:hypothetical protein